MTIAQEVREAGNAIAGATGEALVGILNASIEQYTGWPYKVVSGRILDRDGVRTEAFGTVVCAVPDNNPSDLDAIPADSAAAVIDVHEILDLDGLRAAYGRIAAVKRLRKSPAPRVNDGAVTTVTLGIIFAQRSDLPLEELAAELERLNAVTPSREWPDMLVLGQTGTIQLAVQFPGEPSITGGFLPPAEGALQTYTPAIYVIMVMAPTGAHTFNKMLAFLVAHLAIFSPGAKLPIFTDISEGAPQTAVTFTGYQYSLAGDLVPVPPEFYSDRYLPPLPIRIEDQGGELLAAVQFLPWQDGGVIVLRGKLPLEGVMVFLGGDRLRKAGVVRRPEDLQISYVLPITAENFNEMLNRLQRQSNMRVRPIEPRWIVQKLADEGSASPFMARLFIGILRMRDAIYSDPSQRDRFDKAFEQVSSALMSARDASKEIGKLWEAHARRIASGEAAQLRGQQIHVAESIDKDLRRLVESFLNTAVRALKHGMQQLGQELQVDNGFLFKKQNAFESGIAALHANDPLLAEYLRRTRAWSERLVGARNDVEHNGWRLPRVSYVRQGSGIVATEPEMAGLPVTQFVTGMTDRLCCFVEEFTMHCAQRLLPAQTTIAEIPIAERSAELPARFVLTIGVGGLPPWAIAYHETPFEET